MCNNPDVRVWDGQRAMSGVLQGRVAMLEADIPVAWSSPGSSILGWGENSAEHETTFCVCVCGGHHEFVLQQDEV